MNTASAKKKLPSGKSRSAKAKKQTRRHHSDMNIGRGKCIILTHVKLNLSSLFFKGVILLTINELLKKWHAS